MKERLRIIVSGLLGSNPVAGLTSHYLQYVLCLKAMGHDVHYLEDTGWWRDPWTGTYCDKWVPLECSDAVHPSLLLGRLMKTYNLHDHWTYIDIDGTEYGKGGAALKDLLKEADLLLHVTGGSRMKDEYMQIPKRAYIDTDPGFPQIFYEDAELYGDEQHAWSRSQIRSHNIHFTFGANYAQEGCKIPVSDITWLPTRQPIYFPLWERVSGRVDFHSYTTICNWKPYAPIVYREKTYGLKDVEFKKFMNIPRLISASFEIACDFSSDVPYEELSANGWNTVNALEITKSLESYRHYISQSRAEWSIAKNIYVKMYSGWFSERSAVYLALGKPVVAQSTGFEAWLPTGNGLISFCNTQEAIEAINDIESRYRDHCKTARELAEAYFDGTVVLQELLERCAY